MLPAPLISEGYVKKERHRGKKKKVNMLKTERTLDISNTVFLTSTLQSPKHTVLLLWDVQGGKTSVEKQTLLEESGSVGSIVILTRRPLFIQEPVIHRPVRLSRRRSVLGCPQPCGDESLGCRLNSTSSLSQRSPRAAPAWCR